MYFMIPLIDIAVEDASENVQEEAKVVQSCKSDNCGVSQAQVS